MANSSSQTPPNPPPCKPCVRSATPSGRRRKSATRSRAGTIGASRCQTWTRDQKDARRSLAGAGARTSAGACGASRYWDLKIVAGRILRAEIDRARRKSLGLRDRAAPRSRRLGGGGQSGDRRVALPHRRPRPARRRRNLGRSPRLWTRRAALVFTLPWAKGERDPERVLGWAARLADDREWFIRKAIGWWLRELSKRDPERVRRFLTEQGGKLAGVARREATKYLKS